jgi:hypothetical protein
MARVNYVKKARQLYHTKPVIDPETGQPRRTVVTKNGEPRKDKRGNVVYHTVTVADRDRPKPNLRCDFQGCDVGPAPGEILPGQSYKFISLRFGQRSRHAAHPNWKVWEYSSSRAAQVAQVQDAMHAEVDAWEPEAVEDFEDLKGSLQQQAQDAHDEAREAVENMPEQLQDGSQAAENAEALEAWVDGFDQAQAPDAPDEEECDACGGDGEVDNPDYDADEAAAGEDYDEAEKVDCDACDGTGKVEPDGLPDEWVEEARDALREAVDSCEL